MLAQTRKPASISYLHAQYQTEVTVEIMSILAVQHKANSRLHNKRHKSHEDSMDQQHNSLRLNTLVGEGRVPAEAETNRGSVARWPQGQHKQPEAGSSPWVLCSRCRESNERG